jgi:hypothetical protein
MLLFSEIMGKVQRLINDFYIFVVSTGNSYSRLLSFLCGIFRGNKL